MCVSMHLCLINQDVDSFVCLFPSFCFPLDVVLSAQHLRKKLHDAFRFQLKLQLQRHNIWKSMFRHWPTILIMIKSMGCLTIQTQTVRAVGCRGYQKFLGYAPAMLAY
ncbi:hypothetical protein IHE45_16G001400 [Dioscorea alata]|uniref:Uncharacterized protein n=1 Tax=Dioscorea alata TaxID=55571 RepID=A0ACB7UFB3_DIOAL|nr:hypothetical protein IHE45_16G001400 [Dioscorea alata]